MHLPQPGPHLLGSLLTLALCVGLSGCTEPSDDSQTTDASGDSDSASTEACAERPPYPELYSSCAGAGTCGVSGYACASQTGMDPVSSVAFCTQSCFSDDDCPSVGDCSAMATCVAPSGGQGACALDCEGGEECPANMECLSDLDPDMPRMFCF